jgi:hypothetical protein
MIALLRRIMRRVGRLGLSVAAFLTGLWAAAALIRSQLPEPVIAEVHPKIMHLRENPNRYGAAFLGTSRTYHQVIPEEFDAVAAASGLALTSFNAAADGMFPPEDAYFLDRVARGNPHFRWVFVELSPIRLRIDDAKRGTDRVIYWHDAARLRLLLWEAADEIRDLWRSGHFTLAQGWNIAAMAGERLDLFLRRECNLGRSDFLRWRLESAKPRPIQWEALGQRGDGFLEVPYPPLRGAPLQAYERLLAARRAKPAASTSGSAASQATLVQMLTRVRALGAEPVIIIPPTLTTPKMRPADFPGIVLDFAAPERFPELFRSENRLDPEHLNLAGAKIYTRLLAEEFARAAQRREQTQSR